MPKLLNKLTIGASICFCIACSDRETSFATIRDQIRNQSIAPTTLSDHCAKPLSGAERAGFSPYFSIGPKNWPQFERDITTTISQNQSHQPALFRTLIHLQGSNKFHGAVMAPNGKVYFMPSQSDAILVLDPATHKLETVGNFPNISHAWNGGVLGKNGLIYSIPWRDNPGRILVTDPKTNQVHLIPIGKTGYGGQILAPSGEIFGIPEVADSVLVLNPQTEDVEFFGKEELDSLGLGSAQKFFGGILAPNGNIYGVPLGARSVLKINPTTREITFFGDLPEGNLKWAGGVLAPDGRIFAVPDDAQQILVIDTNNDTVSMFGDFGTAIQKWSFGVLAPNGIIYMIPDNVDSVLAVNFRTLETELVGNFSGWDKWNGAVLAQNGKVYFAPDSDQRLIEMDLCLAENFSRSTLLSTYFNKY